MDNHRLDEADLAILRLLQVRGRVSNKTLSESVNLSEATVSERRRRLEDRKLVRQYIALLDAEALGFEVTAFVDVALVSNREAPMQRFADAMMRQPEVQECHRMDGPFDVLLKVVTRDLTAYNRLLNGTILRMDEVERAVGRVVLQTMRETSEVPL